ncbi:MAG: hypothetical protein LBS57_04060 [Treponema sp.]|jgi:hypothetical protein|nr:hypothetical protein [Treponema sp.]
MMSETEKAHGKRRANPYTMDNCPSRREKCKPGWTAVSAVFFLIITLALTGCDLLLDKPEEDIRKEIENAVWEAEAPVLNVSVEAPVEEGVISSRPPAIKQKVAFSVAFTCSANYQFIEWRAWQGETLLGDNIVHFDNPRNLSTSVIISSYIQGLSIRPYCVMIPKVAASNFPYSPSSPVNSNYPPTINFNTSVAAEAFEDFSFIEISAREFYGQGAAVAGIQDFFTPRLADDGMTLILMLKPEINDSQIPNKTYITITLKAGIPSRGNPAVRMEQDQRWTYGVNGAITRSAPGVVNLTGAAGQSEIFFDADCVIDRRAAREQTDGKDEWVVYLLFNAYDESGSELMGVTITEERIADISGSAVSSSQKDAFYASNIRNPQSPLNGRFMDEYGSAAPYIVRHVVQHEEGGIFDLYIRPLGPLGGQPEIGTAEKIRIASLGLPKSSSGVSSVFDAAIVPTGGLLAEGKQWYGPDYDEIGFDAAASSSLDPWKGGVMKGAGKNADPADRYPWTQESGDPYQWKIFPQGYEALGSWLPVGTYPSLDIASVAGSGPEGYALAWRLRNARGDESPLMTSGAKVYIDKTPPAQVTGLSALYSSDVVQLAVSWTPPADGDYAKALLEWRKSGSQAILGSAAVPKTDGSSYTIENVPDEGVAYVVSVKTADTLGNRSAPLSITSAGQMVETYTVSGTISLAKAGGLVTNAALQLKRNNTPIVSAPPQIAANGDYTITADTTGGTGYTVTVSLPGYAGQTSPAFIVAGPVTGVNFTLEKRLITIPDAASLAKIGTDADYPMNADYVQIADINLSTYTNWTPIGSDTNPFTGEYDGGGYDIASLTITGTVNYRGLFGKIGAGAKIEDVQITSGSVSGSEYVGGICGVNEGEILNCSSGASITAQRYAGGICGDSNGTITRCVNTGTIQAQGIPSSNFGGITGSGGNVSASYNSGNVSASGASRIGGIIGSGSAISASYNTGTVTGSQYVGGIVGNGSGVTACGNTGTVTGSSSVGGVIGWYSGNGATPSIIACYNRGSVFGGHGVCGTTTWPNPFVACYWEDQTGDDALVGLSPTQQPLADPAIKFGPPGSGTGWPSTGTGAGQNAAWAIDDDGTLDGQKGGNPAYWRSIGAWHSGANTEFPAPWWQEWPYAAVTISALAGITPPIADDTPVSTVTETAQFSGTVSWKDASNNTPTVFVGKTVYTATVTLIPKAGFSFTGVDANFFSVAGAESVTNAAHSGTVTVVFPKTEPVYKLISSAADLVKIGDAVYPDYPLSGDYIQTTDIDLGGYANWTPIGTDANRFTGTYNGGGYTISNLKVNRAVAGLFGFTGGGAELKNIHVASGLVKASTGFMRAGAICAVNIEGLISGCSNLATVEVNSDSESYAGGICGQNLSGALIESCYNGGAVKSTNTDNNSSPRIGGICGSNSYLGSAIIACYNDGPVSLGGGRYAGGICGINGWTGSITASYNTGIISSTDPFYNNATSDFGGICGQIGGTGTSINACYWEDSSPMTDKGIGTGETGDISLFSGTAWPSTGTGAGQDAAWAVDDDGTLDGRKGGNPAYWKSLGAWNSGSPAYPQLWWQ